MAPEITSIFLFAYFLVTFVLVLPVLFVGYHKVFGLLIVAMSALGFLTVVVVTGLVKTDVNFMQQIFMHLTRLDRDELAAVLLGSATALPVCLMWLKCGIRLPLFVPLSLSLLGLLGSMVVGSLVIAKELISPFIPHPGTSFEAESIGRLAPPEFVIEDFYDTDISPVRLAISPAGKIFVSGHIGIAAQEGAVAELIETEDGKVEERLVARMLNRPYGLLATDEHVFVSRSGQYTKWNDGVAEQLSTGAITRLTDLDGDGIMDHYHDIVSDLPGAKGPDFLHQNNAIALGPNGALYITTANESDALPSTHRLAGAILRASGDDFSLVDLYATGLRNPFGLAFNSNGELFATDNDPQTGLLGNLGDKLLKVKEGAFYGHPYAPDDAPGVSKPLLRSAFALGGLALAKSDILPPAYQDSLFVVVYGEGRIMQVVAFDDGTYELKPFATIPGAVDLAISTMGEFYVGVYPDKIVRIRLKETF